MEGVDIDTILYSPDKLRLFAITIPKFVSSNMRDTFPYEYEGHAIVGYRLKTNVSWIIYPVRSVMFVGYKNYNMVRQRMRNSFFKIYNNPAVSGIWNYRLKKFESYPSYNVTDPRFWDSSYLWLKDVSVPGYYEFQFESGGEKDSSDVLKIPPIHYPDSLLKLYYENK